MARSVAKRRRVLLAEDEKNAAAAPLTEGEAEIISEDVQDAADAVDEATEIVADATDAVTEANEAIEDAAEQTEEAVEAVEDATEAVAESTEAIEDAADAVDDARCRDTADTARRSLDDQVFPEEVAEDDHEGVPEVVIAVPLRRQVLVDGRKVDLHTF